MIGLDGAAALWSACAVLALLTSRRPVVAALLFTPYRTFPHCLPPSPSTSNSTSSTAAASIAGNARRRAQQRPALRLASKPHGGFR